MMMYSHAIPAWAARNTVSNIRVPCVPRGALQPRPFNKDKGSVWARELPSCSSVLFKQLKEAFLLFVSGCCSCSQVCSFNSAKLFASTSETRTVKMLCRRPWGFKKHFIWCTYRLITKTWSNEHSYKKVSILLLCMLYPCHRTSSSVGHRGADRDLWLDPMKQLKWAKSVYALFILSVFRFSFLPACGYRKQLQMPFLAAACGQFGEGVQDKLSPMVLRCWCLADTILLAFWEGLFACYLVSFGGIGYYFWLRISQFGFLRVNDPVHLWH